ncbi:hypothetical protein IG631_12967 [Alternaria alternata]|nr:hypothetical protein IG631_12967 [Alternaria alternata]
MVRRFETLHLRVLLEKQAELSELENDLNRVDDEERVQQHLSSCRKDKSQQRRGLVREIKSKLRDYDQSILEYSSILRLPDADKQNQHNVKKWMEGIKPVVRSEADWVSHLVESDDFVALSSEEASRTGIEHMLDYVVRKWPRAFANVSLPSLCSGD